MSITHIGNSGNYSDLVIYDKTIYLSGIISDVNGTVYEQTQNVLEKIDKLLNSVGSSKKRVLTMTVYLIDNNSYDEMNRAYGEWVSKEFLPSRTVIGNVTFPNVKWKIELTAVACLENITRQEMRESYLNYIV